MEMAPSMCISFTSEHRAHSLCLAKWVSLTEKSANTTPIDALMSPCHLPERNCCTENLEPCWLLQEMYREVFYCLGTFFPHFASNLFSMLWTSQAPATASSSEQNLPILTVFRQKNLLIMAYFLMLLWKEKHNAFLNLRLLLVKQ